MNKYLIKLADHLDKKGLHKEADYVDWIIKSARVLVEPVTTDDECPGDDPCPRATVIGNLLTHKIFQPNKVEKSYEFKPKDKFKDSYPSFKGSENLIGVDGDYKNLKVMIFDY